MQDLTGKRFGYLTAVERVKIDGKSKWKCICDCGNTVYVLTGHLNSGMVQSCGCLVKKYDLAGQTFGHLTVIRKSGAPDKRQRTLWECKCDCGNVCLKSTSELNSGFAKSCGCKSATASAITAGERFGYLTAVKVVRTDPVHGRIWECICDCGNTTRVAAMYLKSGHTASCGCKNIIPNTALTYIDGTELSLAKNISKPRKNTSPDTGVRGVRLTKEGNYIATLRFRGEFKYLGTYKKLSDAIAARKNAEIEVENFVTEYEMKMNNE